MALPNPPWDVPFLGRENRIDQRAGSWGQWLLQVYYRLTGSLVQFLAGQASALGAFRLVAVPAGAGLYRITWFLYLTQAATTSSSLQVTIRWTTGGIAMSSTGAAVTGNTTATYQSGTVPMLRADPGTSITAEVSYTSTGATPAQYGFDVLAVQVD